jgi:hypothetical protein
MMIEFNIRIIRTLKYCHPSGGGVSEMTFDQIPSEKMKVEHHSLGRKAETPPSSVLKLSETKNRGKNKVPYAP